MRRYQCTYTSQRIKVWCDGHMIWSVETWGRDPVAMYEQIKKLINNVPKSR